MNLGSLGTVSALYGGSYEAVIFTPGIIMVMFIYCMDQLLISKQHGRLIRKAQYKQYTPFFQVTVCFMF